MEQNIEKQFQKGLSAHKRGNLQEAGHFYQNVLQSYPLHPDANHNLGLIAVLMNKDQAALPFLKRAMEISPEVEQFWLSYIEALIRAKQVKDARSILKKAKNKGFSKNILNKLKAQINSDDKKVKINQVKNLSQDARLATLIDYFNNGKFEEAEQLAKVVTKEYPTMTVGWKLLGVLLQNSGKLNEALEANKKCVQLAPDDAEAHNNLGITFQSLAKLNDAEESISRAIALKPDFTEAYFNLGITLNDLGKLAKAETSYLEAIKLKPNHWSAHFNLGLIMQNSGRLDRAEESYSNAIKCKPDFAEAYNNLGIIQKNMGRFEEAEASFLAAISINPKYINAHNNLGNTLIKLYKFEDAKLSLERAIELKPDFAEAHNHLGMTFQKLGKLEQAEAKCKEAIKLKPDFAEAYNNLAIILQECGRLEEAEAVCAQAITFKPDLVDAHYNLGNVFVDLGKLDAAETSYLNALKLEPSYAKAHNNLGKMFIQTGKLKKAEASLKNAIACRSDYAEAYSNLGNTLQALQRLDEAEASYKKAIELKPNFAEAFWNFSGISKTIQDAENRIDKCLNADPTYTNAILMKAALNFYQGNQDEFNSLMLSEHYNHSFMRSFSWVFTLPNLPELHFNKWYFFDAIISKSIHSRPFYEFGVWRASSFKYLIKSFKQGFGFDTFTGLPEDWDVGHHIEKEGTYSSDGNIPQIEGGEFIVGKFEDTLPIFFSEARPLASIINFDADLYSSTICALNFAKPVIDENTILVFDEFIINESWEKDEFKALNEFCEKNKYDYEVLAISFFTKQAAVKLIGI